MSISFEENVHRVSLGNKSYLSLLTIMQAKFACTFRSWLSLEDGTVWAFIGPVIAIITVSKLKPKVSYRLHNHFSRYYYGLYLRHRHLLVTIAGHC